MSFFMALLEFQFIRAVVKKLEKGFVEMYLEIALNTLWELLRAI
jgi:hypothetical protein